MHALLDFCDGLPEHAFRAQDVLLTEGERTGVLYVLISGQVEILKGSFQVYVATEAGAVFGEISALLDIPHTATVRALTPCRMYVVEDAQKFLRLHPEIAFFLSTLLAQRLYSVTTYLTDLKAQFEDQGDHLSMVDEVLETLLHHQDEPFVPGSDRYPDPKI
jgi:CRP/FNR family cyclic AMP-dependent transcriptional regulator